MSLEVRSIVEIPQRSSGEVLVQMSVGLAGEIGQSLFSLTFVPVQALIHTDRLLTGLVITEDVSNADAIGHACESIIDSVQRHHGEDALWQLSRLTSFEFNSETITADWATSSELRATVTQLDLRSSRPTICSSHGPRRAATGPSVQVVSICDGRQPLVRYLIDVLRFSEVATILRHAPGGWVTLPKTALVTSGEASRAVANLFDRELDDLVVPGSEWPIAWQVLAWHGWPVGPPAGAP